MRTCRIVIEQTKVLKNKLVNERMWKGIASEQNSVVFQTNTSSLDQYSLHIEALKTNTFDAF